MEEKKNYYAIIPANVRYDNDLTANAKLLYGEITALCNERGYCWATNDYFSKLYNVSKKTISTWVKQLKDKGYVKVDMNYREGSNEIVNRYIQICAYPMEENFHTPMEEKVKDNNTLSNNTINNNDDLFFETLWEAYPRKEGKGAISPSKKKELQKIGLDEMLRAIERYKKDKEGVDRKYIKQGSTFFNSGYIDYLDKNYEKQEQENSRYKEL